MLGVRLRQLIERQPYLASAKGETAVADPIGKRHQGKAGEAVGGFVQEIIVSRRSQPVMGFRSVDPLEMRDRSADAGRNADSGPAGAQIDDVGGIVHAEKSPMTLRRESHAARPESLRAPLAWTLANQHIV